MLRLFASCVMFSKELEWEMQCDVYSKIAVAQVMGKLADLIQIKTQLQLMGICLIKG